MVTRIIDGNNANRLMLLESEDGSELITTRKSAQGVVIIGQDGKVIMGTLAASGVASAVTGSTAEVTLATFNIPAGTLGKTGAVRVSHVWSMTNNANPKTAKIKFNGTTVFINTFPSIGSCSVSTMLRNRDNEAQQVSFNSGNNFGFGPSSGAPGVFSIDTTVDIVVTVTMQLAVGTDTAALETYTAEIVQ